MSGRSSSVVENAEILYASEFAKGLEFSIGVKHSWAPVYAIAATPQAPLSREIF